MKIDTNYKDFTYLDSVRDNEKLNNDKASKLSKKKLKEAAEGIEAEFLKIFLKESKKTILSEKSSIVGKDMTVDLMIERFAEDMAKRSPLGISNMIIEDIESRNSRAEESKKSIEEYEEGQFNSLDFSKNKREVFNDLNSIYAKEKNNTLK